MLGIKTIEVNYLISEWLKQNFFKSNPIPNLMIRNKEKKIIENEYL